MVKKEEEKEEDNSGVGTRMGSTLLFRKPDDWPRWFRRFRVASGLVTESPLEQN